MNTWKNTLYYGDNLKILREYIADESVDLIYLDPPFNSNRSYNVLFKDESGQDSEAQLTAFEDTWHWDRTAEETYRELVTEAPPQIVTMIGALREFIGTNQIMAYLAMMTARLIELHRVLKPTGSLYLHCDPTMSHYLKIVLDMIFGGKNFRSEIIWNYRRWPAKTPNYQHMHDVLFYYAKKDQPTFNIFYEPATEGFLKRFKGKKNRLEPGATKKHATEEETPGMPLRDVWDISIIAGSSAERLGYPTQKPIALLDRIIQVSSNEGDLVLDPFCGCGTAVHVAHKLKRRWIGIDITHLAVALQKYRLKDAFGLIEKQDYDVIGEPQDLAAAQQLAQDDRYQFQWWALSLIQAQPIGGESGSKQGKKGTDRGIDGIISFLDDPKQKPKKLIVQVKSGHVKSGDIRDLVGTLEREQAAIGVFITLEPATKEMQREAVSAGFYHSPNWNKDFQKIQILTIEELLSGAPVQMPPTARTYKKAQRETETQGQQQELL
jgi:site-specific DNA-methyltransferase (adenine-specific)